VRLPGTPFVAACFASLVLGCGGGPSRPVASGSTASNLLLITIDTLRADRVGAYGHAAARTPVMDAIARQGVRFERAFATAPLTLTSHASLLTGRYPPGHGARNNGMRMRPVPTLATLLRASGFATAAFVAAFPLDRRFGLADAFDTYSDHLTRGTDGRPLDERPAREVADEAIAWMQAHSAQRLFVWVHLFEPHAPYGRADAGDARPPAARYDDEVAIADRETGRVVAALGPRGSSTLIVVAADHGESFGEHGEFTHGIFVYDTTLRVPLLMKGPGLPGGAAVPAPVSLVDVAPTALAALGLPPADTDGIDLRPLAGGRRAPGDRVLYSESFSPLIDFGWSSLRAVRSGRWKYIAAPTAELYDVQGDPGEATSAAASQPEVTTRLGARADGFSGAELPREVQPAAGLDPDATRRLQALGYVGSHAARTVVGRRADPKDRKALARHLALVLSSEVQGQALEDALRSILRADAGNAQAHLRLGYVLLGTGRLPEADRHFRAATEAGLDTADPWLGVAQCAGARGDLPGAEAALRRADSVEPGNPVVAANLGILLSKTGRGPEAVTLLGRVVKEDPQFSEARFNLALAYARAGRHADALSETHELLRRLPPDAPQRQEVERLLNTLSKQD